MQPAAQHRSLATLVHDRRGVVGLYFAIVLSTMALLSVAALDLIRVHMARSRVSIAADSAILAAGRSLSTLVVDNNANGANWQTVGAAFFNANINSAMGLSAPMKPTDLKQVPTGTYGVVQVDLTINASLPILSAAFGNLASMPMVVSETARNRNQTAELVMVLDNTGSMTTNDNIGALRNDAAELVRILQNGNTGAPTLDRIRVGIVPYAATVNPGATTSSYITGKTFDLNGGVNWKGCLLEPLGRDSEGKLLALSNSPPIDTWRAYEAPSAPDNNYTPGVKSTVKDAWNNGNSSTGPNVGCPTPILPMTRDIATLTASINNMQAWSRGGTISDIGLAWGYRLLSPEPPFTQAAAFKSGVPKYLVMMTDGAANFNKEGNLNPDVISDYTGYGRVDQYGQLNAFDYINYPMNNLNDAAYVKKLSDNEKKIYKQRAASIVEANITMMCDRLKGNDVQVFTITFGGLSKTTEDIYRNCASNGGYYSAPDKAALQRAFQAIGFAINELVLVK